MNGRKCRKAVQYIHLSRTRHSPLSVIADIGRQCGDGPVIKSRRWGTGSVRVLETTAMILSTRRIQERAG